MFSVGFSPRIRRIWGWGGEKNPGFFLSPTLFFLEFFVPDGSGTWIWDRRREFRERPPRVIPEFILAPSPGFVFFSLFFGIIQGFSTPTPHSRNPQPGRVGNLGNRSQFLFQQGIFVVFPLSLPPLFLKFPKFVLPWEFSGSIPAFPRVHPAGSAYRGKKLGFPPFPLNKKTGKDPRTPEKIPRESPNVDFSLSFLKAWVKRGERKGGFQEIKKPGNGAGNSGIPGTHHNHSSVPSKHSQKIIPPTRKIPEQGKKGGKKNSRSGHKKTQNKIKTPTFLMCQD